MNILIQLFNNWLTLPQLNIMKLLFVVRQNIQQPLGRKSAQSLALIKLFFLMILPLSAATVPSRCKHVLVYRCLTTQLVMTHDNTVLSFHVSLKFKFNRKIGI